MDGQPDNNAKIVLRKEDIFLIPNLITYFRVLCVPVFVTLCLVGGLQGRGNLIYWSFGVFFVAAISDLFDGKIARKYNMVSDIGKVFDPLADKLMHICVLISLTIIGYISWYFVAFICLKELIMVIMSPIFVKKRIIIPAVMIGKVASAEISVAVGIAFFHNIFVENGIYLGGSTFTPDWFLMLIGTVLAACAGGTYIAIGAKKMSVYREMLRKGEIDKWGRLLDQNGNLVETASDNA